jgi:hypothetical protein
VIPETFDHAFHWEDVRHGNIIPESKSLRKLSGSSLHLPDYNEDEAFYHNLGASIIGPFLNDLCNWAIDECLSENRTSIHPLMREGYLLSPMLETIIKKRGLEIEVKPLYVSIIDR